MKAHFLFNSACFTEKSQDRPILKCKKNMFESIKGNGKDKKTLNVKLKKQILWCTYDNVQEEIKWK